MLQLKALYNKLFGQKNTPKEIDKIQLLFYISEDNHINLKLEWNDSSESSSDILASLLYCLNKGLLFEKIISTLNDSATDDQQIVFIKTVLSKWNNLCSIENDITNEPVVKPLGAFNANTK